MSQVKKLQSGGSFTIDGIKYDATPEFINALTTHLKDTAGTDAQTLAGLSNALQNGQNLRYDSASNTISGMDGIWSGITQRQNERRKTGASTWRKFWDAQLDTDAHRFRNALSAIGSFHYQVPKEVEETPDLTNIYGDQTFYEYNTDEKGNKTWLDNSSKNIGIEKRLADWTDYLSDFEAGKKKYKLGDWYSPERVDALRSLYAQYNPETWNSAITAIGERAKSNSLTPNDKAFLENFNIVEPGVVTETVGNGINPQDKQKWIAGGHEGLIPLLGQRAIVNDDGSISLRDGESWGWNLGDLEGKNIWFNDDFFNSRYGADGTFDPYRNYTLYNNRLYALDNPTLARILNADGGFNAMMKSGNWTGADNQIVTRFTDLARENPAYLNADEYSTFLSANPNYRFSDLTGLATTNGMTEDQQLIQYVDLGDNSLEGPYRRYNYKYALLNDRGGLERELTPEEVIQLENGHARETGLNTYKRTVGNNGAYNNRYYEDIFDKNGQATGFRFYRSIKNPNEDVILHMPSINASGVTENQDIVIPKEIAQVLSTNTSWLKNVIGNAQNKKNFINIISSLIKSRIAQRDNTGLPFDIRLNERNQLKKMGFSESEVEQLKQALQNYRKGSRSQRREDMLVNSPQFEKNGGVLKDQKGGIAGGTKAATAVTEKRIDTTNTNPDNSAGIVADSKNWTDADTADIAALVADVGSLGAAFVPGANVASAVTGAAGSTARLYADLNRGTKGAGWNYLVNLGMDAATLLPIAGGAANTAKVIRAIKRSLPTIIKAASVYGLGTGVVDAAKKIISGQKFTVRDIDMLVNALTAGIGLGKSGGFGKATKTSKTKAYSENFKLGDTEVKLGDSEIKSILKASDQPKALREAIKKQAPKASDKDIADAAEGLLKTKATLWQKIRGNDGDIVLNVKKKPIKTGIKVKPTGNKLHDWWYGVGINQRAYNLGLQGRPQREFIIETGTGGLKKVPSFNEKYVAGPMDSGSIITKGVDQLKLSPYFTKNRALYELAGKQHFYVPKIIPNTMANRQQNIDVQPSGVVMQPLFKEGGKIVKAELGTAVTTNRESLSIPALDSSKLLSKAPTIVTSTAPDKLKVEIDNRLAKAAAENRSKYGADWGQFSFEKWNPDLTVPLNWARSLYAMKQSDDQLKNFLNRPHYQHQDLLLNAPRYINTGTGNAYRNQANQLRLFKPTTSNALQNDLMARDRQREALQAELQGNLADSQEYGQYKNNLDAFTNDLRMKQYNIADTNSQLRWQHAIEDVQAKNANIAEKSKSFDQAAYATQDWYNRNYQLRNQLNAGKAYNKGLAEIDDWYRTEMSKFNTLYKDDPNSDNAQRALALIKSQLNLKQQALGYSGIDAQLAPIFKRGILKKGGKVSTGTKSAMTYSRDPYPELLLENAKDSTEIVKQLNDAVIKLLLQTKPINVH